MKSAAAATSSRLATYSVMLMFYRSRFSRRAWLSAGVSGYVWNDAAGECGGIPRGAGALLEGGEAGAETGVARLIIRSGGDTGHDSSGTGETAAKGNAGARGMLTSAGTDVAAVGTLLAAAVVPSRTAGPAPSGESTPADPGAGVAPGPGWPEAWNLATASSHP